jgi:hypothetical protein
VVLQAPRTLERAEGALFVLSILQGVHADLSFRSAFFSVGCLRRTAQGSRL